MTLLAGALILGTLLVIVLPLFTRRATARAGSGGSTLLELDEAYRSALADLQDTELDWQVGNLSEADYQSLRDRYRLQAASVLQQADGRRALRESVLVELERERSSGAAVPLPASDPLPSPSPAWGRGPRGVSVIGGLVAVVAVGMIVYLSLQLAGRQAAQAPLATLPVAHAHTILLDEAGAISLGHHDGLLRSADGLAWAPTGLVGDVMGIVSDGGRWLAFGHDLLSESVDGGKTWARLNHDLPGTDVHGAQRGTSGLYAYVMGHGLFRSTDGVRWTRIGEQVPQEVGALAVLSGPAGDVVFLASGGTVLRSADGGRTWSGAGGAGNLALSGFTQTVAADPTRGALYAATSDGIYRSLTGGSDWTRLPYRGAAITVAARGDRLALVDERNRFFESKDGGGSWLANP